MDRLNTFFFLVFSLLAASAFAKISIQPSLYEISIVTKEKDFKDPVKSEELTFDGSVSINFNITQTAEQFDEQFQIVLNTDEKSKIHSVRLTGIKGNKRENITITKTAVANGLLKINASKDALSYKEFNLAISYTNPYGNDMTGFYRSSYKDASGNTRWLLTTHFEPIFARKAFPCFDQPKLKAFFKIKLTVPKAIKTILCNTPASAGVPSGNNLVFTCDAQKLPMSTYLVAFTASEFVSTEGKTFDSNYPPELSKKRTLRTFGREEIIKKNEGKLAQEAGKEALDHLTQYLDLGYALEKVDQIGIPDFSAGAMENWGHISFREKSLFFNENTGSTTTKQSNLLTITHELVHQWFGNLVTLESWDYIWLNEAFANYLEYVIASQFKNPDTSKWNLMNQMVVNEIHFRAFETDGLNSSKPLNNKITDEKLIFSSFNDIPYSKGAAVLRMWNIVLKDNFQKTLREYIKAKKGKSANPSELMTFFKNNGMKEKLFTTWTDQEGYPVVEVKKVSKKKYSLTQSRFFWENIRSDNATWFIPITFTTSKSPNFNDDFKFMENKIFEIETKDENENWILVNNHQAGYYRVNYEKENWEALSSLLRKNSSALPEVNRAQIVNDIFSLARSLQKNYVEYSTALNLATYLEKEKSLIVLKTGLNAFDFLQTKLYKTEIESKFKEYVLNLIKPHFKTLNSTGLEHTDKLKNIEICRWACALEYQPCIEEAKKLVKVYNKVPDTQETILCSAIRSNDGFWDELFKKYQEEEDSSLKLVYLTALGCTKNAKKAEEFLNKSLPPNSGIRKQDSIYVLSAVYNGNLQNVDIAFRFVENNYKIIFKEYGGINPLGKALVGIAKKLNTKEDFARLKNLAEKIKKDGDLKGSEESVANALQIAESNFVWVREKESQLKKYFVKG